MDHEAALEILVVDDRAENRFAIASALASLGERVVLASSGEEALRHLLQREFALILLDVTMPGLDGFETARLIKALPRTRDVPLIFTSASLEVGSFQAQGYALGAVDYLPTPLDPDLLRAKAAVFLELHRKSRALREQARELALAIRYKDEFLNIVSHELKTPLTAIMGFTELLQEDLAERVDDEHRGYLEQIADGANQVLRLVNDLLDMGRIQAGRFSVYPTATRLAGVMEDAVAQVAALARRRHQKLVVLASDDLPELMVDPDRIRQVFLNLLSNAIKFTPQCGEIVVSARPDDGLVRCEVQDSGPGVPPENRTCIFEPFTRLDNVAARKARGTGLGLSIAKAIIEGHGGEIGVMGPPGHHSTFWFTLPVGTAPPEETQGPGGEKPSPRAARRPRRSRDQAASRQSRSRG